MTVTTRIRLLIACCALAALASLPAVGLAADPATATKPQKIPASGSAIVVAGKIHLDSVISPFVLQDSGTVTGTTGAYAGLTTGPLEFQALHSLTGKKEAFVMVGTTARPGKGTKRG